jgi:hypothetical protein
LPSLISIDPISIAVAALQENRCMISRLTCLLFAATGHQEAAQAAAKRESIYCRLACVPARVRGVGCGSELVAVLSSDLFRRDPAGKFLLAFFAF